MDLETKVAGVIMALLQSFLLMHVKASKDESKEFTAAISDVQARVKNLEASMMTIEQVKAVFADQVDPIMMMLGENKKALELIHDLDKNAAVMDQKIKSLQEKQKDR